MKNTSARQDSNSQPLDQLASAPPLSYNLVIIHKGSLNWIQVKPFKGRDVLRKRKKENQDSIKSLKRFMFQHSNLVGHVSENSIKLHFLCFWYLGGGGKYDNARERRLVSEVPGFKSQWRPRIFSRKISVKGVFHDHLAVKLMHSYQSGLLGSRVKH